MASKKRGLSADEKRARLLEFFYENNDFFQMKELEKSVPKRKGIVSQSVKEVTQLLVDEGLVNCEKIGTFVCYWAFPSEAAIIRKRKIAELNSAIEDVESKLAEVEREISEAKKGKEDSKERAKVEAKLEESRCEHKLLKEKVDNLSANGPEAMGRLFKTVEESRSAANRWTDNIFTAKKWCQKKFGIEEKAINAQFNIPADLDYID